MSCNKNLLKVGQKILFKSGDPEWIFTGTIKEILKTGTQKERIEAIKIKNAKGKCGFHTLKWLESEWISNFHPITILTMELPNKEEFLDKNGRKITCHLKKSQSTR